MRRARTPVAWHWASSSSRAVGSPETTIDPGPFTAAIASRSPQAASLSSACSAIHATDIIPPLPASPANAWPRSATTRAASSRDSAPATHAAAISPWECPTTADGFTPHERHSSARDTITAKSAGCTTSTRSRLGAPGAPSMTSRRDQSTCAASASPHSRKRAAKMSDDWTRPSAMPVHWAPWPGKTKAVRPLRTLPETTVGEGSPLASAAKAVE
jgi:hypothetical protein